MTVTATIYDPAEATADRLPKRVITETRQLLTFDPSQVEGIDGRWLVLDNGNRVQHYRFGRGRWDLQSEVLR